MKRKHLNLLLAVAVLALVPAIYFSRDKPKPPPVLLTPFKADAVTHALIHHEGAPDIALEKRDGIWWLTKPVSTRADAVEINGVLDLASRTINSSFAASETKLADLGLEKPLWFVQLNDMHIDFGDLEPIQGLRYVRIGDRVDLIDDPPSATLDANYSDLVSKRLLPEAAKIQRIQFKGFAVTLNQKTGGWQVEPKSADRGADSAQKLVNAWAVAQSMWNAMTDPSDKPQDSVTVTADNNDYRFDVLNRGEQLVLSRADLKVKFTLPKNLAQDLFELQAPAEKAAGKSALANTAAVLPSPTANPAAKSLHKH